MRCMVSLKSSVSYFVWGNGPWTAILWKSRDLVACSRFNRFTWFDQMATALDTPTKLLFVEPAVTTEVGDCSCGHVYRLYVTSLSAGRKMSTGQGALTVHCGWKGNRRSGVALVTDSVVCPPLYRRFPDNHFPGQTFPGQDVSRTRRFPDNHFPGQTFLGQVILRNFHVSCV